MPFKMFLTLHFVVADRNTSTCVVVLFLSSFLLQVFDTHFSRLLRMERNISEFFQYQGQMKANMGEFQKMDHQQRVKGAKEMLYQLIQLVDETSAEECSDVLEFALVSLAPRLTRLPCKADLENELAGL